MLYRLSRCFPPLRKSSNSSYLSEDHWVKREFFLIMQRVYRHVQNIAVGRSQHPRAFLKNSIKPPRFEFLRTRECKLLHLINMYMSQCNSATGRRVVCASAIDAFTAQILIYYARISRLSVFLSIAFDAREDNRLRDFIDGLIESAPRA